MEKIEIKKTRTSKTFRLIFSQNEIIPSDRDILKICEPYNFGGTIETKTDKDKNKILTVCVYLD